MWRHRFEFGLLVTSAALAAGPAGAHHSSSAFNQQQLIEANGVVRTWEYTNPHSTLWVYINDEAGVPRLWALEAPSPVQLMHDGWNRQTVKPGDKVGLSLNPLRDGRNGGLLVTLILSDGHKLNLARPPPP